jgi:site-specific DNA recombinase
MRERVIVMTIKENKKVWALYRVSTDRQGAEGDDIPVQKAVCTEFANKNGWTIIKEITEKVSGFQTAIEDRHSLKDLMKGAESGQFDILLLYHSDRLGRQIEYSLFIATLYEKGVQVWSVKEGELRNAEHTDSLLNYLRYWTSEGESRKTSMRVKDSMRQLNEEGCFLGGTPPYGYTLEDTGEKRNSKKDKTIKKLVADSDEATIVKLIFSLVLDKGYGASRIAQYLNDTGYSNKGRIWRHNSISRMLRNPVYMGYKKYNATEKLGLKTKKRRETSRDDWKLQPFNPELLIISEFDFEKVQRILDSRTNKSGTYEESRVPVSSGVLLSGLVVCGYCGHKLKSDYSIKYHTKTNGERSEYKVYRYKCHYAKNFGETANHIQKQFGAKTVDEQVEAEVLSAISKLKVEALNKEKDDFDFAEIDARKIQLKDLEKQYEEKTTALANTETLFDKVMSGQVSISLDFVTEKLNQYGAQKMELMQEIDKLRLEIKESEIQSDDLERLKYQLDNWVETYKSKTNLDEKKAMLGQVLKEVSTTKDEIVLKFKLTIEKALRQTDDINEEQLALGVGNVSNSHRDGWTRLHNQV